MTRLPPLALFVASLIWLGCETDPGRAECTSDGECSDFNDCTAERCENETCVNNPVPDGTSCELDEAFGTCRAGVCEAGDPSARCDDPPEGRFTVIEDQAFDDGWEYSASHSVGATVMTEPTEALATGGAGPDPSAYRSMTHVIENPAVDDDESDDCTLESCSFTLVVSHQYTGETFRSVDAIEYIDYSESHLITEPAFTGAAVGWTFAVWQDGVRYLYTQPDGQSAFRDTEWATVHRCGLEPGDFSPAPGPDFSADASEMTFGFTRSNTNTSPDSTQRNVHGIDDFRVVIVASSP